ncbi:hypothetical protein [Hoeflea ulvae]|uniref:General stress protein n=1 Tax=Hoeflea ulvae TaxID=2983764 RepID=A0ABT3YHS2_9HYPH|nr:hypothetical protein [Hoeflea ulvae]MCY0095453.1 general stress protein [Hoeflea ulvae]
MSGQSAYSNTTEAVGVFHTAEDLQAAIDDLLSQGFNRMDLSILASETAIEDKLHEAYVPAKKLEDRVEVPTTAFVSTESIGDAMGAVIGVLVYVPAMIGAAAVVASGGALAAAATAALIAGGVGGSIGTVMAGLIGAAKAEEIEQHLQAGGLLLWVRTRDEQHEERALGILKGHNGDGVHLHTLPSLVGTGYTAPIEDVVDVDMAKSE